GRGRWALHVFEDDEPAAGTEQPPDLSDRRALVRDGAQRERGYDRVESIVGKLQGLGVAEAEVDLAAELGGALAGEVEHLGAEVDPDETDPFRIEAEVPAGSDGDLQRVSEGLGAGPFPPFGEEHSSKNAIW